MDYGRNWCKNSIWYKIHKYLVGNTTVNASYVGDDKYAASYKIINIEVTIINTNLTVEPDSLDLTVGDNAKINATLIPGDAGTISFKSSNDNIVTVDNDGKVNATGKGNATILSVSQVMINMLLPVLV